jgi:hypothetical protein
MNIRAYEGYNQPMGSDLLSALRTEGEKFLANLAQPVRQQISQSAPAPAPAPAPEPEPVIAARALSQPEQTAAPLSPIAIIIMLYIAWYLLGKK